MVDPPYSRPYNRAVIQGRIIGIFLEVVVIQAKFSLEESHIQFLAQRKRYGFKDKSDVVRTALDHLHTELARQRLCESADLYAKAYEKDDETQEWTDAALSEWPT